MRGYRLSLHGEADPQVSGDLSFRTVVRRVHRDGGHVRANAKSKYLGYVEMQNALGWTIKHVTPNQSNVPGTWLAPSKKAWRWDLFAPDGKLVASECSALGAIDEFLMRYMSP